jgi:hypothetical protein
MVKSSTMTFINEEDDLVSNLASNNNNNTKFRSSFLMTNPIINTNTLTRPSKKNRMPSSSSLHSIKSHQTQQLNSNNYNNNNKLNALNSVSSHQQQQSPSLNNSISSAHNTSLTEVEYNGIICQAFFCLRVLLM